MDQLLRIEGLTKAFPGQLALDGANLDIRRGEIHALVGPNGCGKSTLIKILAGFHQRDAGSISFQGEPLPAFHNSAAALSLGFRFIHQDLALVPSLSVAENLALGFGYRSCGRSRRIRWRTELELARKALEPFGLEAVVSQTVSRLSPAEQAVVAIARSLRSTSGTSVDVLVLDEPTALLPHDEVEVLFRAVRSAAATGAGVLHVSHRLGEVLQLADRVTVMRDGRTVATRDVNELDERTLVDLIVGGRRGFLSKRTTPEPSAQEVVLSVRGLTTATLDNLSFELHLGEVLGVTGLIGCGVEEIGKALYSGVKLDLGTIEMDGVKYVRMTPDIAKKAGIGFAPADRRTRGSIPAMTSRENLTLPAVGRYFQSGRLRLSQERAEAREGLATAEVIPLDPEKRFLTLSGGNQQKVMIEKWLRLRPRVLVLEEPTEGVDIGTKAQIYNRIRARAAGGTSFLVISAEWDDLPTLCDRVLVLGNGSLIAELMGSSLSVDRIISSIYSVKEGVGATGHRGPKQHRG